LIFQKYHEAKLDGGRWNFQSLKVEERWKSGEREDGRRETEDRSQKSEDGSQETEDGRRKSEDRRPETGVYYFIFFLNAIIMFIRLKAFS
jgi:hypothetical protein